MLSAILAAVIAGLISPIVVLWLQHRYVWRLQKRLEMKYSVFQDAVRALSLWSRDALDLDLQTNKPDYKGTQRKTELRPETDELLERSKLMVQAFFSPKVYGSYDAALRSHISIEEIPNTDFEKRSVAAILAMARELGIKT